MQFCHMQRFIHIDIAQASQKRLIQEQSLQLALARVQARVEISAAEGRLQGFGAQFAKHFLRVFEQPDAAKLARIIETKLQVVFEIDAHARMFAKRLF